MIGCKLQKYGEDEELEVVTDLSDVVQVCVHNGGLIQYVYLDVDSTTRLIRQLSDWRKQSD